MTKDDKEKAIRDAAAACHAANVEADMQPVSRHLLSQGHPFGGDFCFVLCVAFEVGNHVARGEGFKDQFDRSTQLMRALMEKRAATATAMAAVQP